MLAAVFADREDLIDLPPQADEVVVLGREPDDTERCEPGVEEPWETLSPEGQTDEKLA